MLSLSQLSVSGSGDYLSVWLNGHLCIFSDLFCHTFIYVVDEIYALSVFGQQPFVSAASLVRKMPNSLHIVWAFSKDFAMSGQ